MVLARALFSALNISTTKCCVNWSFMSNSKQLHGSLINTVDLCPASLGSTPTGTHISHWWRQQGHLEKFLPCTNKNPAIWALELIHVKYGRFNSNSMNASVTSAELYKEHYEADRHAQSLWEDDADNLNTISTGRNAVKGSRHCYRSATESVPSLLTCKSAPLHHLMTVSATAITITNCMFAIKINTKGPAAYAMKKALRETQTLRAGCSKVEPKILAPP